MKLYLFTAQKFLPTLKQYQLKKISSFLFTVAQLLIGAVAVQLFETSRLGELDSNTLMVLILYIVSSSVLSIIATFVAGKVKDKYA